MLLLSSLLLLCSIVHAARMGCKDIGPCELCDSTHMSKAYCQETGKMQAMRCIRDGSDFEFEEFRSCKHLTTPEGNVGAVLLFLLAMAAVGGASYIFAQKRKIQSMTKYEYRKVSGGTI